MNVALQRHRLAIVDGRYNPIRDGEMLRAFGIQWKADNRSKKAYQTPTERLHRTPAERSCSNSKPAATPT